MGYVAAVLSAWALRAACGTVVIALAIPALLIDGAPIALRFGIDFARGFSRFQAWC